MKENLFTRESQLEAARETLSRLSTSYVIEPLEWDKTALKIAEISEENFKNLLKDEGCEGIYYKKTNTAIIKNFAGYRVVELSL